MYLQSIITKLANKHTYLTYAQIENILIYISTTSKTNTQIVNKFGIPNNSLNTLLKDLSPYITFNKNKYGLEQSVANEVKTLNKTPLNKLNILNKIKAIKTKYGIKPKRELDQFFATNNTTYKKANILKKLHLHKHTSIALIGDDDLVSIAIALMFNTCSITVFEIDTNISNYIKTTALKYKLNITVVPFDCKNSIPQIYLKKFDCVLTDPPYTPNGVELFLDRGLALIKNTGNILINYGNSFKTYEKYLVIQNIISKYNLFVCNVFYNFNTYKGAYGIGSKSSLYHLKPTLQTTSTNVNFTKIYTFEEIEVVKFPFTATYSYKLLGVDTKLLYSKSRIDEITRQFAKLHNLKIVDSSITKFLNSGFTFNYTLSTSSLVIHTWPELKAIHILIDVCSPVKNEMLMVETLAKLFGITITNISFKKYL